jgi:hypothetical protein
MLKLRADSAYEEVTKGWHPAEKEDWPVFVRTIGLSQCSE